MGLVCLSRVKVMLIGVDEMKGRGVSVLTGPPTKMGNCLHQMIAGVRVDRKAVSEVRKSSTWGYNP